MNFKPHLTELVMADEDPKTVTRRRMSANPRSPSFADRCALKVGGDYAVCPGRGKRAVGRVRVTSVDRVRLGDITHEEALREGFDSVPAFEAAWRAINRKWDADEVVWRVAFHVIERHESERSDG